MSRTKYITSIFLPLSLFTLKPTLSRLNLESVKVNESGYTITFKASSTQIANFKVLVGHKFKVNTTVGNSEKKFIVSVDQEDFIESDQVTVYVELGDKNQTIYFNNPLTTKYISSDGKYERTLYIKDDIEFKETISFIADDFVIYSDYAFDIGSHIQVISNLDFDELSSYNFYINLKDVKYELAIEEIEKSIFLNLEPIVCNTLENTVKWSIIVGQELLEWEGFSLVNQIIDSVYSQGKYGIYKL